jgi:hypothetical protein
MQRPIPWRQILTFDRLWPVVVAALGIVPGVLLIVEVWQVDPDGVSSTSGKWPTWDFTNLWAGGVLASSGRLETLFDPQAYTQWLRDLLSPRIEESEWSYPPTMLLLGLPLAKLPLIPAYLAWTAGTLALFWAALRWGGLGLAACAAALLSPAVLHNIALGQNGALTGALLAGALLLAKKRPGASGVLMGLLAVKPHLGVLLPVCVLAQRNWRALGWAAPTAASVVALSAAILGLDAWRLFFLHTGPKMRAVLEAPWPTGFQISSITVFLMVRALGASLWLAYAVQGAVALACAALAWRAWRMDDADPQARMALTAALTLLASPYGYSYDMLAFTAGVAALLARAGWRVPALLALAWLWPGLTHLATYHFMPISPPVIAAAAFLAWRGLKAPALAPS